MIWADIIVPIEAMETMELGALGTDVVALILSVMVLVGLYCVYKLSPSKKGKKSPHNEIYEDVERRR